MKYLLITLVFYSQVSGSITKNNGDQVTLNNIEIYQKQDNPSISSVIYQYRGAKSTIEIAKLKRINLKESLGKKKGVTTWLALLVTHKNEKYEVEIDLVEIKGINSEGKEEVYSSNIINKISL